MPMLLLGLLSQAKAQPSYGGCNIFPANMAWNVKINTLPVHPNNGAFASVLGSTKLHLDLGTDTDMTSDTYYGIPWNQAPAGTPWVPITFDPDNNYHDESDCATGSAAPYTINSPCGACGSPALTGVKMPIPANAKVESGITATSDGSDHHLLIVDTANCSLWEVYQTYKNANGWLCPGGIARWDLKSGALRTDGWTSSDAAGLPVMPLILRQDEAAAGLIKHAFRFTLIGSKIRGPRTAYEWPARHNTGTASGTNFPLMGQRWRLKSTFAIPTTWSVQSKAIATAFMEYGIILADIGSNMFIQGEPHASWDAKLVDELQTIGAGDFEAVDISGWKNAAGFNANSGLVPGVSAAPSSAPSAGTPTRVPTSAPSRTPSISAAPSRAPSRAPSASSAPSSTSRAPSISAAPSSSSSSSAPSSTAPTAFTGTGPTEGVTNNGAVLQPLLALLALCLFQ